MPIDASVSSSSRKRRSDGHFNDRSNWIVIRLLTKLAKISILLVENVVMEIYYMCIYCLEELWSLSKTLSVMVKDFVLYVVLEHLQNHGFLWPFSSSTESTASTESSTTPTTDGYAETTVELNAHQLKEMSKQATEKILLENNVNNKKNDAATVDAINTVETTTTTTATTTTTTTASTINIEKTKTKKTAAKKMSKQMKQLLEENSKSQKSYGRNDNQMPWYVFKMLKNNAKCSIYCFVIYNIDCNYRKNNYRKKLFLLFKI